MRTMNKVNVVGLIVNIVIKDNILTVCFITRQNVMLGLIITNLFLRVVSGILI